MIDSHKIKIRNYLDSSEGHSGSPLFYDKYQVVGIHKGATTKNSVATRWATLVDINMI